MNNLLYYPIYYLNLDRSSNRNKRMIEMFKKYKIINYTRISGIDGNNIDPYMCKKKRNFKYIGTYDNIKYEINPINKMNIYEVGTLLSHYKALLEIKKNNDNIAIICEDDISLEYSNKWNINIKTIVKNAPNDWEVIKIGTNNPNLLKKIITNKELYLKNIPLKANWGAFFYIINKKYIKNFIKEFVKNNILQIDNKFNFGVADYIMFYNNYTYTYTKPLIICDESETIIHNNINKNQIKTVKIIRKFYS